MYSTIFDQLRNNTHSQNPAIPNRKYNKMDRLIISILLLTVLSEGVFAKPRPNRVSKQLQRNFIFMSR